MIFKILCLLLALDVHATVFQKLSVEEQIKEADGIIIGHYLRSKGIKLEDGQIATQMIFKINKEFGLGSNTFGMDEVIVHYPGGKFEGEFVKVEGVPSFISGEKVALFIKSRSDRYWGLNLGFGTFKIINYGNEKIVVNTIFPDDRKVGQIKLSDFEKSVKTIKGSGMLVVRTPEYPTEKSQSYELRVPASVAEGKNRAIASKSDQVENIDNGPSISVFWLVTLLAVLGGAFRFVRKKHSH